MILDDKKVRICKQFVLVYLDFITRNTQENHKILSNDYVIVTWHLSDKVLTCFRCVILLTCRNNLFSNCARDLTNKQADRFCKEEMEEIWLLNFSDCVHSFYLYTRNPPSCQACRTLPEIFFK
jgi:hypothetical protein